MMTPIIDFKASIKSFENSLDKTKMARLSLGPDLPIDSAIWVLEAAMNYDFDSAKGTKKDKNNDNKHSNTTLDSLDYPTTIALDATNPYISRNDLILAYEFFENYFDSITSQGGDRIKIIDLIAETNTTGLNFKVKVIIDPKGKPGYPFIPNCDDIGVPAMWSSIFTLNCSPPLTFDGPTLCQTRLNCANINGHGCFGGFVFYTDVSSAIFASYNYPTIGYWLYPAPACNNAVLSAATLNSYVLGNQSVAAANLPPWLGLPPVMAIQNYAVNAWAVGPPLNNFWSTTVTYGRAWCSDAYYPPI